MKRNRKTSVSLENAKPVFFANLPIAAFASGTIGLCSRASRIICLARTITASCAEIGSRIPNQGVGGSGGKPAPSESGGYSRCDCCLWSGSLYRTAAVQKIGLPQADYVLDWGDLEYGYRARRLGFTFRRSL